MRSMMESRLHRLAASCEHRAGYAAQSVWLRRAALPRYRSAPNLPAALQPALAGPHEEEQPVLARDYSAARVSRLLLAVGEDLAELPACAVESAQGGEELSAAGEPGARK